MLLSDYREDSEKQANGAPIYIGDATFFVRRFGNKESKEKLKELREKLYGPLHKWTAGDDDMLMAHWLAEYGVVNWDGVSTEDGELKYSKKTARMIFLDTEYHLSLNAQLINNAAAFENYLYEAADEDTESLKKN